MEANLLRCSDAISYRKHSSYQFTTVTQCSRLHILTGFKCGDFSGTWQMGAVI